MRCISTRGIAVGLAGQGATRFGVHNEAAKRRPRFSNLVLQPIPLPDGEVTLHCRQMYGGRAILADLGEVLRTCAWGGGIVRKERGSSENVAETAGISGRNTEEKPDGGLS